MSKLSQSEIDKLTALEESLWCSDSRFDIELMREIIAEDFFEYGRSGRKYTREETLPIKAREVTARFPLPGLQVRELLQGVAQITYNSEVDFSGNIEHARRSSIWTFNGDKWQLRFHQGTPFNPND
jgi:hypothetical protein